MHASVYSSEEHMYIIHNSYAHVVIAIFYLIEQGGYVSAIGTSVVVFDYFCFTRGSESK